LKSWPYDPYTFTASPWIDGLVSVAISL
jgi:hypothetical protein